MNQPKHYLIDGKPLTLRQLAQLAGCSPGCMTQRLKRHTPEAAVAMGAADKTRIALETAAPRTESANKTRLASVERFPFKGQQLTCAELAALAGITPHRMRLRLRYRTPEQAVAMGSTKGRKGAAIQSLGQVRAPKSRNVEPLAANAEVIVPPNVKRTVAPTPADRFAITSAPQHFSARKPGQYDADAGETALARAGVARGAA